MLERGAHFQTGILTARNPDYPPNVVLCLGEIRQGPTAILGELRAIRKLFRGQKSGSSKYSDDKFLVHSWCTITCKCGHCGATESSVNY